MHSKPKWSPPTLKKMTGCQVEVEVEVHIEEDIVGEAEDEVAITGCQAMILIAISMTFSAITIGNMAMLKLNAGSRIKASMLQRRMRLVICLWLTMRLIILLEVCG